MYIHAILRVIFYVFFFSGMIIINMVVVVDIHV